MAKKLDIGAPPTKIKSSIKTNNTAKKESGAVLDLNFKVSADFKREFKLWAVSHDVTQKRALELAFESLKEHQI